MDVVSEHLAMYEQYTQRLEGLVRKLCFGTDAIVNPGGYLVISNTVVAYDESGDRIIDLDPDEFKTVKELLGES